MSSKIEIPETKVLNRMFEEIGGELAYINSDTIPALLKMFGPVLNTGIILRCAEQPGLLKLQKTGVGFVPLNYKDEIKFNGKKAVINKPKFLKRYYSTDEGKRYKAFLESLDPVARDKQFNIF